MGARVNLLWYPRIVGSMAHLVNRPLTPEKVRVLVRTQMETREERFLAFAARYVYGYPRSPYLPLLRLAGCEHGDMAAMVRQKGLEATLETLRDAGVYFSFDEFRGRIEVSRGGRTFRVSEEDFDNPFVKAGISERSGGTRSQGVPISMGLRFVEENTAPALHLAIAALNAATVPVVIWVDALAAAGPLLALLHAGHPPVRWFSLHDPREPSVRARLRLLPTIAAILAWPRGVQVPRPEFTPVSAWESVLESLIALRDRYRGCAIWTTPSTAVRLASGARTQGETLDGVHFLCLGEPLTPGKAAEIRASGAHVGSLYGFTGAGAVGVPCGDPHAPDDMHFLACGMALIRHRRTIPEVGDLDAYMFTSLTATPPKILLNVEMDDFGEMTTRRCGCPLDELGLRVHLSNVRSFTKLTGEGSTILGTDCVQILEDVLPREFGGRSIDYQLLEAEDDERLTRLFLLVSPEVGPVDEQRVGDRFVEELRRRTSQGLRLWRQAETIRVVRREPVATPRGKILPFHTQALAAFMVGGSAALAALAAPHPAGRPT